MENRFLKGLFKDTGHIDQPKGTWRYALNAVFNTLKGAISNEQGVSQAGTLFANRTVIGSVEVSDGRVVLFLRTTTQSGSIQSGTGNPALEMSEIGVWEKGVYKSLFSPNHAVYPHLDLAFSTKHLIEGTFKLDSKGDLIVYFTDDLNPPRAFNVSMQERNLTFDPMGTPVLSNLYGMNPSDSNTNQIFLLNLFPHTGDAAQISQTINIHDGGSLRTAVYYLAIAYVGDDLAATNYMSVSNPVSIVEESRKTTPTNQMDGGRAGNQTSKSIAWTIENLNTVDYKYIRPVVIRKMGEATDAFKLNDFQITATTVVVFSGTEGIGSASLEEVMIDTVSYDTAKTINQLDGVLYVGNTTGSKDIGYQKYANNIKLESTLYTLTEFDTFYATVDNLQTGWGTTPVNMYGGFIRNTENSPSYRNEELNSAFRGYMRGEVYAFYISFVLRDGSMSYAYHIPGRDILTNSAGDTESAALTQADLVAADTSETYAIAMESFPDTAYYAQFWDFSSAGSGWMNYWKNLTEFYPNTPNYDVMDGITVRPSLRTENVRHHAFPRNATDERKTIMSSQCGTSVSGGTTDSYEIIDGTWSWRYTSHAWGPTVNKGSWMDSGFKFNTNVNNPTNNTTAEVDADSLFDGQVFTANQPMNVSVSYYVMLTRISGSGSQAEPTRTRIKAYIGNTWYYSRRSDDNNIIGNDNSPGWPGNAMFGCGSGGDQCDSIIVGEHDIEMVYPESAWTGGSTSWWYNDALDTSQGIPFTLGINDYFFVEGKAPGSTSNWIIKQTDDDNGSIGGSWYSSFTVVVDSGGSSSLDDEQFDAKIDHTVSALGFHLDDIKVPKSLLSKVQGFRIYRAKRGHENKTILGQSVLLPMHKREGALGMCEEATGVSYASHVLGQVNSTPETFYVKSPWALNNDDDLMYPGGYTAFSFHDFNLLRTHNSLAPATHLQIQYKVNNYVWNGPSLQQDKKMLTKLLNPDALDATPAEVYKFQEIWGYDTEFGNCYPKDILSAIFIGNSYNNMDWHHTAPKVLGQKAKSYLLGDSIFSGTSLGFGGKVFNEFGESCVILGLKDGFKLPSLPSVPEGDADDLNNTSFGYALNDGACNLVNEDNQARNQVYIANLAAYKSDVYKSIDSQELVYTGYEILGDALHDFVFDDETGDALSSVSDTFSTKNKYPDGIFGGDTFICRYGFVSKVTPSNTVEKSNPIRSINYHIVESSDNINFRHSEDSDTSYFPGTSAKDILSNQNDLTHVDSIKYTSNYSEDNIIKPAFPLPLRDTLQDDFPTRTHRSATNDTTSLIDNYRIFLANQYKDLPKNRGELWKLASFNNLLYFHMESSLYAAKGKQTMEMKDGTEAFIGSGDIFQQNPDEVIQTELGYGGTQSQWAALTTRYGYFFVDQASYKVFLMGEGLTEISPTGMDIWFKKNLVSKFTYADKMGRLKDNPAVGIGLHASWDPLHKRILLTFRDLQETAYFNTGLALPAGSHGSIAYNENTMEFMEYELIPFTADLALLEDYFTLINAPSEQVIPYPNFGVTVTVTSALETFYFPHQGGTYAVYVPTVAGTYTFPADADAYYDQLDTGTIIQYSYSANLAAEYEAGGTYISNPINYSNQLYFKRIGWTLSYYPEVNFWGSFHTYIPYMYFSTHRNIYSVTDFSMESSYKIWEHNSGNYGEFYPGASTNISPFEIEYVSNLVPSEDTLTSSISYTADVVNDVGAVILEGGFTSAIVYNTLQMSESIKLAYLVSTRRIGNSWKINKFRDMAKLHTDATSYYAPYLDNVVGEYSDGTITSSVLSPMFKSDGMDESQNLEYLDLDKAWNLQKKFVDKWIGVRLICNNNRNNLVNLYSTTVAARKTYR